MALVLGGCGSTKQAGKVTASGFLGDYSQLKPGSSDTDDPLMIYANPNANCRKYKKIMIDPVKLWAKADGSSFEKLEPQDRAYLTNEFGNVLREVAAKSGFQVVDVSGADVMRIRAAITEAQKSDVLKKEITVVAPYVSGAAVLWSEAKGQALFTGDAAYELEVLDSITGERLYAAIDKRVGKMDPRNFHAWDDVKESLKVWSDRGIKRLSDCRLTGSFVPKSQKKGLSEEVDKFMP